MAGGRKQGKPSGGRRQSGASLVRSLSHTLLGAEKSRKCQDANTVWQHQEGRPDLATGLRMQPKENMNGKRAFVDRRRDADERPNTTQVQRKPSINLSKGLRNFVKGYRSLVASAPVKPERSPEKSRYAGLHISQTSGNQKGMWMRKTREELGQYDTVPNGVRTYTCLHTDASPQNSLHTERNRKGEDPVKKREQRLAEAKLLFGGCSGQISHGREWKKPEARKGPKMYVMGQSRTAGGIIRSDALKREMQTHYKDAAGHSGHEITTLLEDCGVRPKRTTLHSGGERRGDDEYWRAVTPKRGNFAPDTEHAAGKAQVKPLQERTKAFYAFYPQNKSSMKQNMLSHYGQRRQSDITDTSPRGPKVDKEIKTMFHEAAGDGAASTAVKGHLGIPIRSGKACQKTTSSPPPQRPSQRHNYDPPPRR